MVAGKEVKRLFPEPRAKITRAEKAAAKVQKEIIREDADNTPTPEVTALAIIPEGPAILKAAEQTEVIAEPESVENTAEQATETAEPAKNAEDNKESGTMEINYNVTGNRRKELATAVGEFIGAAPVYQKAPTYAFAIGSYIIDRNGTPSGEKNEAFSIKSTCSRRAGSVPCGIRSVAPAMDSSSIGDWPGTGDVPVNASEGIPDAGMATDGCPKCISTMSCLSGALFPAGAGISTFPLCRWRFTQL